MGNRKLKSRKWPEKISCLLPGVHGTEGGGWREERGRTEGGGRGVPLLCEVINIILQPN